MSSGEFDKIIKENLTDSFLSLLNTYLGIHVIETVRLPALKQTTIEREVDFLAKVKTIDQQEFILHLEFQSHYETGMKYRMAEYGSILLREYRIPIRQFVVYMGSKKVKVSSKLPEDQVIKGFEWLDLSDIPYQEFLTSESPELIILGILSDFGTLSAEELSLELLHRLHQLGLGESDLRKYITQLEVLSNLRNLNNVVNQSIKAMPITFDIRKSAFYQEGVEAGKQEGKLEGRMEGRMEGINGIILNMYQKGIVMTQIADLTGIELAEIKRIIEENKESPG